MLRLIWENALIILCWDRFGKCAYTANSYTTPSQGASASEAELDPGSFSSSNVNQDPPVQDPGSFPFLVFVVSTGISVGDDRPELVIEEFSSSQSSSQSEMRYL